MTINNIKKWMCVGVFLAIMPAISFAHEQGLAALSKKVAGAGDQIYRTDTIPAPESTEESLEKPKQSPSVKRVPKSRRQAKPLPLPSPAIKPPVIKPKIIRPVIKVTV